MNILRKIRSQQLEQASKLRVNTTKPASAVKEKELKLKGEKKKKPQKPRKPEIRTRSNYSALKLCKSISIKQILKKNKNKK